jgi:DNA-binding winged helix-turn-helix (wHTH) protein
VESTELNVHTDDMIKAFALGDWTFDTTSRRLLRGSDERRLSPKAAHVLSALADSPGQVWSRDALMEKVWPNVTVSEEVLTHAIAEIRRALSDSARKPRFLETVHKSGYRLLQATSASAADAGTGCDLELYATYLKALDLYERGGVGNTRAAIVLFESILERAPDFLLARVGLAKALTFVDCLYPVDFRAALDQCEKARKAAPNSAEALAADGFARSASGDFAEGARRITAAVTLNPESAEAHYLFGRACMAMLRLDAALPALHRAAVLRADDFYAIVLCGKLLQMTGETEKALGYYRRALGRIEARLEVQADDYRALCGKVRCLTQLGRHEDATRAMERVTGHDDPLHYALACSLAQTGAHGDALEVLEQIVESGWRYRHWLGCDPDFAALRGTRRYQRLAASAAPS